MYVKDEIVAPKRVWRVRRAEHRHGDHDLVGVRSNLVKNLVTLTRFQIGHSFRDLTPESPQIGASFDIRLHVFRRSVELWQITGDTSTGEKFFGGLGIDESGPSIQYSRAVVDQPRVGRRHDGISDLCGRVFRVSLP